MPYGRRFGSKFRRGRRYPARRRRRTALLPTIRRVARKQAIKAAESQYKCVTVADTAIASTWVTLPNTGSLTHITQGDNFGQRDGNEVLMSGIKLELTLDNENGDGYNVFRIVGVNSQYTLISDTGAHPLGVNGPWPESARGKYDVFYDKKFMLSGTGGQTARLVTHWIKNRMKLGYGSSATAPPVTKYPQFMIISDSSAAAHPDVVGTVCLHYRDP